MASNDQTRHEYCAVGTGGVVPTESLSGTIGAVAGGTVGLIVLAGLVIMACMVYQ